MIKKKRKPRGYWQSKENCKAVALTFETRSEFSTKCNAGYNSVMRNNWVDLCSHMVEQRNTKDRYIYAFEFKDTNSVYIGLSWNLKQRHRIHLKDENSSVYKHIKENTNIKYDYKELGYYSYNKASDKEGEWLENYLDNGWESLNVAKTGGLGGKILYWTKEHCLEEALKYKTRFELHKGCPGAYHSAWNNGWLNDMYPDTKGRKPPNYWDEVKCHQEALKYKTKREFEKGCGSAYNSALKNKWFKKITKHMKKIIKSKNYWNYDTSNEASLDCKNRFSFQKKYTQGYIVSLKNGWLDEFFPIPKKKI